MSEALRDDACFVFPDSAVRFTLYAEHPPTFDDLSAARPLVYPHALKSALLRFSQAIYGPRKRPDEHARVARLIMQATRSICGSYGASRCRIVEASSVEGALELAKLMKIPVML